ncbi:6-carboxyhexanoate--CoA ligase [Fibrobacter sp. UWEL]|uniref:6-carboxyhexanoate--CoA ligase n=1 Tax=Fibrobacter sp. UWEL TaxID=1896209 RepID=UPI000917CD0D|nr:6-carboxyhexanoate--CoA ligase [Fibrobacter sp. UWEL]SHK80787.1 6-carboxyhexanoate--CoA ligase [Fibrobacter sp. UWEL]
MDYYSLKMRASQDVEETGADGNRNIHEQHISGAERIVSRDAVEYVCQAMVRRAMTHSKGDPDKINIKIEKVAEKDIQILDALPVTRVDVDTWQEGLDKAFELVNQSVVKASGESDCHPREGENLAILKNFREKLPELLRATYPMRGAMLYDIRTGNRLEPNPERGVRATYMDALQTNTVDDREPCGKASTNKNHFNEAIVLATKVANAPGMVAELCISDDPDYVTGYVASKELGYVRIMKLKEMGNPDGGRVFLFDSSKASAEECIDFLQKKKVLVRCK